MVTGIGHLAFRIANLDRSLDFYCNKLGFREAFRLDREGMPSPWIVYIQVSPTAFIELFPVGAPEGSSADMGTGSGRFTLNIPEDLERSTGNSYHHVSLTVDDIDATLRELVSRGVPLESLGKPSQGMDHNWQYWIADPDGNRIELMQITPESPHAKAGTR
jgi:catechol 2,3-dioxygenase-like lactoylglutathione lyase family enzyme